MDSPYDSDMSEDTRELVERGLVISRRKYSSRAGRHSVEQSVAPTSNMYISSVHYPLTQILSAGTTSTQGLVPVCGEIVLGQICNSCLPCFAQICVEFVFIKCPDFGFFKYGHPTQGIVFGPLLFLI